jgi:type II secretion system protein I
VRRPRSNGFTLIESVAALAVAAIALVALLQLHLVSMRAADKAQVLTQAVLLAQEKMTETLSGGYPSLGVRSGLAQAEGTEFSWQIEVTEARLPVPRRTAAPADRLRQLSVQVTWPQGPGQRCITLTTYAAENSARDS